LIEKKNEQNDKRTKNEEVENNEEEAKNDEVEKRIVDS